MITPNPLVSILINNYNYGRFLAEAIDSALQQTYPNTEVIVVDDGSTDDSREVIAAYGDRIIPVLKENGGQASAFNAGIRVCRGEWVCFLDSDDLWKPGKVARIIERAAQRPDAGFIYDTVQPVDKLGKPVGKRMPHVFREGDLRNHVVKTGGWWPAPPTSALSVRSNVLNAAGTIPEVQFRLCADAFITYMVPLITQIAAVRETTTIYRLHGENGFSSTSNKRPTRQQLEVVLSRYRSVIEAVNERLTEMEVRDRLSTDNHFPYQRTLYHLRKSGHQPLTNLIWQALTWPELTPNTLRTLWSATLGTEV